MELSKFKNKEYALIHVEMKVCSTDGLYIGVLEELKKNPQNENQTFAYK